MQHITTIGMCVERYTGTGTGTGHAPYLYGPPLAAEVLDVLCFVNGLEFLYFVEVAMVRSV